MNTFTINGKDYKAKPFDFNMVCSLDEMGIPLESIGVEEMATTRAYFAVCAGKKKEAVGKELEQHFLNGGDFSEIMSVIADEIKKSDFFHKVIKMAETEDSEMQNAQNLEKEKN